MKQHVSCLTVFGVALFLLGCPQMQPKGENEKTTVPPVEMSEKNAPNVDKSTTKKSTVDSVQTPKKVASPDIKTVSHGESIILKHHLVPGKVTVFKFGADW